MYIMYISAGKVSGALGGMIGFKHPGEYIEQYFLALISGSGRGRLDAAMRDILFIASRFYRAAVQFRHWMYDKRIIRNHALGCLVVSIGNLSCGGTGKTPVTEVFARSLNSHGRKVAILSRGYRSRKRPLRWRIASLLRARRITPPPKIVSDGGMVLMDSRYAGDEPFMLASNLPGVAVLVDKDRVKAGKYAVEHFGSDVIILDDGFQYLMLKPHINIVLIDSTDPFGNGHTLPRGILREPIKNIRRADYILLTKSDGGHRLNHLKNFLRRHTRRAEIIECCHRPRALVRMFGETAEKLPLEKLRGAKVAAISAIARPESFENFLCSLGAVIVCRSRFADHHRYTPEEIDAFAAEAAAAGADFIVTTEKDAVRMPASVSASCPFFFLRIEIEILSGRESFDQCISRICFL